MICDLDDPGYRWNPSELMADSDRDHDFECWWSECNWPVIDAISVISPYCDQQLLAQIQCPPSVERHMATRCFLKAFPCEQRCRQSSASTAVLMPRVCGGVELCGRAGVEQLPMFKRLCGLSALSAWGWSALPHLGGVQHQAAIAAAGPASHQDLQALGAHLAKHSRLGSWDGLSQGIKKDLLPHRPFFIDLKTAPSSDIRAQIPSKERFA